MYTVDIKQRPWRRNAGAQNSDKNQISREFLKSSFIHFLQRNSWCIPRHRSSGSRPRREKISINRPKHPWPRGEKILRASQFTAFNFRPSRLVAWGKSFSPSSPQPRRTKLSVPPNNDNLEGGLAVIAFTVINYLGPLVWWARYCVQNSGDKVEKGSQLPTAAPA